MISQNRHRALSRPCTDRHAHGWSLTDDTATIETDAGNLEIADPEHVLRYWDHTRLLLDAAATGGDAATLCRSIATRRSKARDASRQDVTDERPCLSAVTEPHQLRRAPRGLPRLAWFSAEGFAIPVPPADPGVTGASTNIAAPLRRGRRRRPASPGSDDADLRPARNHLGGYGGALAQMTFISRREPATNMSPESSRRSLSLTASSIPCRCPSPSATASGSGRCPSRPLA